MATQVYNETKRALLAGELDFDTDDIRAMLVMSNTTVETENDGIEKIDDFTTLDECDDTGYSRQALASEAVATDDANDRAAFDAADITFTNNGNATRTILGVLIYKHVDGTAANDIPLFFLEFASAKTLDGSDFVVQFDSTGLLRLA